MAKDLARPLPEEPPQAPVRWREILSVVALVALADLAMYRGHGFAGYALVFLAAPGLLLWGSPRPKPLAGAWVVGAMMLLLAAKLVWCGSGLLVAAGFALLAALSLAIAGLRPYVEETVVYAFQTVPAGYLGLVHYRRCADRLSPAVSRSGWLSVALPLAALVGFGTLFILANPDVFTSVAEHLGRFFRSLREWILRFAPTWQEVLLWIAVAWVAIGLLRPIVRESGLESLWKERDDRPRDTEPPAEAPLYAAFRNTLLAVIGLFAVYLVFEFKTLWFRVFPKGFYYSGYAHEGAAWLTVALALATVVLSAIFRGRMRRDPRLGRLQRLAWIWSAENMLLALAVYHRLYIYIGFNGMTRMRTVGIFGISAVVVGFVLVVWKIACGHHFLWLWRRHLWTLAVAVYLFAVTPVDALVHTYNVRRILAGDPAPSVQISVHPIDSEGILVLHPLLQCDDPIIREGIRAMLARHAEQAEALAQERQEQGWTAFQLADQFLLEQLRGLGSEWEEYADPAKRTAALARFHEYAYQWY